MIISRTLFIFYLFQAATEPITLKKCLEAFTRQEELGDEEKYYCSECKKHQLASKKLQIWRLPPILIVHLKRFLFIKMIKIWFFLLVELFYFRFHFVNGRWIKSHKIVDFPNKMLDPTDYLAAIPQQTILRHKELVTLGKFWKWFLSILKFTYSEKATKFCFYFWLYVL